MKFLFATAYFFALAFSTAAMAQILSKEDIAKGQALANSKGCAACHNVDGNSTIESNPKLAGQHPEYLVKQLADFKPQEGRSKPLRAVENSPMNAMGAAVSSEEAKQLAAWFSSNQIVESAAKSQDLAAAGRKLYRAGDQARGIASCSGCHGPTGAGIPPHYPHIAGQFAIYIEGQLKAFRSGERANSKEMRDIASLLSDHDIKALADYVAGLR
jgi:cytochrome c553